MFDGKKHGVQLDTETGRIYFIEGSPSNVCFKFLHPSNLDPNSGHINGEGRVGWTLYHPEKDMHYMLETQTSKPGGVGNYVLARSYKIDGNPSSTFGLQYYGTQPDLAIQEAIMEDQEVIETIEKTEAAVALANKTIKQKKILEEIATAEHQNKVLKLRQKCFPKWETEKVLRLRLATMSQGGQATKIKDEAEALENTMIAGVEVFLSYAAGLVDLDVADKLLVEDWKLSPLQLHILNDSYSEFGLKSNPQIGKDRIIRMPGYAS